MHTRQNVLNEWLHTILPNESLTITPLAGDASFRRYFRLQYGKRSGVIMDAPPKQESITPFLDVGNRLRAAGIRTPSVYAADSVLGFALLEDFGDMLFLQALSQETPDALYTAAMTTLLHMQNTSVTNPSLPHFNPRFMQQELALFREWFLQEYLSLQITTDDQKLLENTFQSRAEAIARQPQVFIHRDYHSRNLLLIQQSTPPELGVIDFQDAMLGPLPYDLVSLLKDCYVQWPRDRVIAWMTYFYTHLPTGSFDSLGDFQQAFDYCGLQRHLKVLGVFSRLHLRDGKSNYLRDLPLTLNYVLDCLECYSAFEPFYHFMQNVVAPAFMKKQCV